MAEGAQILGELQNGFRPNHRMEDNLFVVTSSIEIAAKEKRELVLGFSGYSPGIPLSGTQSTVGGPGDTGYLGATTTLVEALYTETQAVIHWRASTTRPIYVYIGLRQGCPMPPIQFMLFTSRLERRLVECGVGFNLTCMKDGTTRTHRLPVLLYADDIVLLVESVGDLQSLVDMCSSEGDDLGLRFSAAKSLSAATPPPLLSDHLEQLTRTLVTTLQAVLQLFPVASQPPQCGAGPAQQPNHHG
ncbi:uncharacterized protein LOC144136590 [Amblyomma americanum]